MLTPPAAVLPKVGTIFGLELPGSGGVVVHIFGNHFRYRSFERSVRKFKYRATVEI